MSVSVRVFVSEKYWPAVRDTISAKWRERSEAFLTMILAGIGDYPINQVPVEVCEHWLNALRARYRSPVTPNRALLRAKHIFSTAQRWGYCTTNPFQALRKKKEPVRKFVFLSDEQHARLMYEAGATLQWYIVFARYTGGRMSSLGRLEERDVNRETNELTFRQTKNGEDYTIPIHPALLPWINKALTGNPNRRLLPQYADVHSVSQLFRRLRQRLGIVGFRFHDYRHNLGSRLAARGHNAKTIMAVLGHRSEKMSIHYTHVAQEHVQKALAESI